MNKRALRMRGENGDRKENDGERLAVEQHRCYRFAIALLTVGG